MQFVIDDSGGDVWGKTDTNVGQFNVPMEAWFLDEGIAFSYGYR